VQPDTAIQYVKGIGPAKARLFGKLGVSTIEEACLFIPRRYEDRSRIISIHDARVGQTETIIGEVKLVQVITTRKRNGHIFEVVVDDQTGFISVKWFRYNYKYMKQTFRIGVRAALYGLIEYNQYSRFGKEMYHPEYEILGEEEEGDSTDGHVFEDDSPMGRVVPVYPATEGFPQRVVRELMRRILEQGIPIMPDILPVYIQKQHGLISLQQALQEIHFPETSADVTALNSGTSPAHRRLVFEELYLLELGLAERRRDNQQRHGTAMRTNATLERRLREMLPFQLTKAQEKVLSEIKTDLRVSRPMHRLLQGDVGSGKTIVALISMLVAVENGYQAAIMAPTEVLAEQHFSSIKPFLEKLDLQCLLLKGNLRPKVKAEALSQIASGGVSIVVGTHALIQKGVRFAKLGLAVIDEQHRFGVRQRMDLIFKGLKVRGPSNKVYHPHLLSMSATPIPRSLSLTVYGDLEMSVISELPPGRKPIETKLYYDQDLKKVYHFLEEQIQAGGQAFLVYPLVEESEKLELKAAVEMFEHLQTKVFSHLRLGLVHGRMNSREKDEVMIKFRQRQIQMLVATTVIEVGIDVPTASVMVIEHAERFGLAQLHQLRGRVGRGPILSYCILLAHPPLSKDARERLQVALTSQDGFAIAEADLRLRGPGEFLGTRQAGLPELKVANIIRDAHLLEKAREAAFNTIRKDPQLREPEHLAIKCALNRKWETARQ